MKKYWGYFAAFALGLLTFLKLRDTNVKTDETGKEFVNKKIDEAEKKLQELEKQKNKPVEELSSDQVKDYWKH